VFAFQIVFLSWQSKGPDLENSLITDIGFDIEAALAVPLQITLGREFGEYIYGQSFAC
jgi:hypothetical protein